MKILDDSFVVVCFESLCNQIHADVLTANTINKPILIMDIT